MSKIFIEQSIEYRRSSVGAICWESYAALYGAMNLVVAASGYEYFAPDGAEKMVFYETI